MEKTLHQVLYIVGWVFYLLSVGLYMLLIYGIYQHGYTFFDNAQGDMMVMFLGAAIILLQSFMFSAMIKHNLRWLAVGILLVCWISVYKGTRHIHLVKGTDTRWDTPIKDRLGSPRSTPALL